MKYYQARARTFQTHQGQEPHFPNEVELSFTFQPLQPFGMKPDGGTTAVTKASLGITVDSNSGRFNVTSNPPLLPLSWQNGDNERRIEHRGNQFRLFFRCADIDQLEAEISRLYYLVPPLLSIEFADPVFVTHVGGKIGELVFTWAYETVTAKADATTQAIQEEKLAAAWTRIPVVEAITNRRLFAALNFFYIAARLRSAGYSPWEFMGEVILNLSKCLEALFKDGEKWHDTARTQLLKLGFSSDDIERGFVPALKLRNLLDSGHVKLTDLSSQELRAVHEYSDHAVANFRVLMDRLLSAAHTNPSLIPTYTPSQPNAQLKRLLEQLSNLSPSQPIPQRFSGSITLRGPFRELHEQPESSKQPISDVNGEPGMATD